MTSVSSTIRLRFLGTPGIAGDGLATTIADRKLALLLFLLATGGRSDRIALADKLWPGTPAEKQLASMRLRIHKARQLHPDLLALHGSELALGPGVTHDLEFMHPAADIADGAAVCLGDAPLLSGIDLRGLDHVERMVQNLRDLMVSRAIRALHRQAQAQQRSGRLDQSVALLRRILVLAPLSETASRHLMCMYLRHDDRASALQVFERLRQSTRALLGAEPGARTRGLHARILREEATSADAFDDETMTAF